MWVAHMEDSFLKLLGCLTIAWCFSIDMQSSLYSAFAGMVLIKICMLRQSSRPKRPIRVAVFDAHCERNQIGPFQKPSQQDDGVYIYIYIHNIKKIYIYTYIPKSWVQKLQKWKNL